MRVRGNVCYDRDMSDTIAIVSYDEIALKGANRRDFEEKLCVALAHKLAVADPAARVERWWGRIVVRNVAASEHVRAVLAATPGVVGFGLGALYARDAHDDTAIAHAVVHAADVTADWATFRVTVKRVDKTYPGTSQDLARRYGAAVADAAAAIGRPRRVALRGAQREVVVEILHKWIAVYVKERGIGGLPVGASGRAVALLSGGFDSPVAAWMMAKRGIALTAVHFHGMPHTSPQSVQKVRDLARRLAHYAGEVRLITVPIVPTMKAIALEGKQTRLRVVLLRRAMNRIAQEIAAQEGAGALVTGESVGQVASQTLENMAVTAAPVEIPILRPLCGMNKQEIIALAKEIGTHDISVRPHDDTCSNFMPRQVATRARSEEIAAALKTYDEDACVARAVADAERETFSFATA